VPLCQGKNLRAPDFLETVFQVSYDIASECFMLYKSRPPAAFTRPTPKSMPQLDFSEALSTPEEKLFSQPATVTAASTAPLDKKTGIFARGVRFNRSTWANIFFVAIASIGGLVCAFYFFNGGELLRAAAAWPNEFLYPRPFSTDKIDIGVQISSARVQLLRLRRTGTLRNPAIKALDCCNQNCCSRRRPSSQLRRTAQLR